MSDPFRYDGGQYRHSPEGAGQGEQFLAGVNQFDSPANASWKVQSQRTAMGLDPHTGALPWRSWHALPVEKDSRGGNVMAPLLYAFACPVILAVLAALVMAGLASLDALWRGKDPAGGLARFVAARVARDVAMAVPAAYLQPKQIESAARGDAFWRTLANPKPTQKEFAAAYLCQLDAKCAARAEAIPGKVVFWWAEHFLFALARKGNQQAAVDMCLLPLMTVQFEPVLLARQACVGAARESNAPEARRLSQALEASWWAHAARAVEWTAIVMGMDAAETTETSRKASRP